MNVIYPEFRVSSSGTDTPTAFPQEKVPLFFFISAPRLGKGQLKWKQGYLPLPGSTRIEGGRAVVRCLPECGNEPSCPCLWRAPHPHRSQPRFDFVNSWPKSGFRCSQTIPISFTSWLVNIERITPFVHNRIQSCIYPSCGETVLFEKYSTRWHYMCQSISLLSQTSNPVHLPFISQNSWCFFSTKQKCPSLGQQTLASLQS